VDAVRTHTGEPPAARILTGREWGTAGVASWESSSTGKSRFRIIIIDVNGDFARNDVALVEKILVEIDDGEVFRACCEAACHGTPDGTPDSLRAAEHDSAMGVCSEESYMSVSCGDIRDLQVMLTQLFERFN